MKNDALFAQVRKKFVQLSAPNPLIYFDNAATTLTPTVVWDEQTKNVNHGIANVHRGTYRLAEQTTQHYEAIRAKVAAFIGAKSADEIVFTSGATASLNLVAFGLAAKIQPGQKIVISPLEHHANLVVWQQIAKLRHASLAYLPLNSSSQIDMTQAKKVIDKKTAVVSVTAVANVAGTIVPIKQLAAITHHNHAVMIVDAAQMVGHMPVDVLALDADFLAFSGHKMYAATGIGVLYGKKSLLEQLAPQTFGGEMINHVTKSTATFAKVPLRLEAGTPNILGVFSLGAAIDWLTDVKMTNVWQHEQKLTRYLLAELAKVDGISVYGSKNLAEHAGVISFNIDHVHAHDTAFALDVANIAVRAGDHCAQPYHQWLGVPASVRLSLGVMNTQAECDVFLEKITAIVRFFTTQRKKAEND